MDTPAPREPALLGIPEERHIAVTPALEPNRFGEIQIVDDQRVLTRSMRTKPLPGQTFYLRQYHNCVINGDRAIGYSNGELIRESRYLNKIRSSEQPDDGRVLSEVSGDLVIAFNRPWRNYWHWLLQCMFSIYVVDRFDHRDDRVFMLPANSQRRAPMLSLLGLDEDRIRYFPDRGSFALEAASYSNAMRADINSLLVPFRDSLIKCAGTAPIRRGAIYISRRDSPKRQLRTQDALERMLQAAGVEIVVASELSFQEQIATFQGCDLVIAPHGAGLTNIVFCRPGTPVVEIRPGYLPNQTFRALARVCGLPYVLVSVAARDSEARDWTVDPALVMQIIEDPKLFEFD